MIINYNKLGMVKMVIIIVALSIYIFGCNENQHSIEVDYHYEELEISLMNEPLVFELLRIRDEITSHIISNEIDISELKKAYLENDEEKIEEVLRISPELLSEYSNTLNRISYKLLEKYPLLEDIIQDFDLCNDCNKIDIIKNIEDSLVPIPNNSLYKTSNVTCKWIPYTASLVVCSAGGPILYWPCAYVAVCAWCEGGWVDDACFK